MSGPPQGADTDASDPGGSRDEPNPLLPRPDDVVPTAYADVDMTRTRVGAAEAEGKTFGSPEDRALAQQEDDSKPVLLVPSYAPAVPRAASVRAAPAQPPKATLKRPLGAGTGPVTLVIDRDDSVRHYLAAFDYAVAPPLAAAAAKTLRALEPDFDGKGSRRLYVSKAPVTVSGKNRGSTLPKLILTDHSGDMSFDGLPATEDSRYLAVRLVVENGQQVYRAVPIAGRYGFQRMGKRKVVDDESVDKQFERTNESLEQAAISSTNTVSWRGKSGSDMDGGKAGDQDNNPNLKMNKFRTVVGTGSGSGYRQAIQESVEDDNDTMAAAERKRQRIAGADDDDDPFAGGDGGAEGAGEALFEFSDDDNDAADEESGSSGDDDESDEDAANAAEDDTANNADNAEEEEEEVLEDAAPAAPAAAEAPLPQLTEEQLMYKRKREERIALFQTIENELIEFLRAEGGTAPLTGVLNVTKRYTKAGKASKGDIMELVPKIATLVDDKGIPSAKLKPDFWKLPPK